MLVLDRAPWLLAVHLYKGRDGDVQLGATARIIEGRGTGEVPEDLSAFE